MFGDNDVKRGKGGQAIIRDEPNTCGITTKKFPSNYPSSFYTDDEYEENCKKITLALEKVRVLLNKFDGIIVPSAGFGTGLAKLNIKAPKTLLFIETEVKKLIDELQK